MADLKVRNRITIETSDFSTYEMFGTDGDHEDMIISREDIGDLESYLYDLEDEEDGRVDEDTWNTFNTIKEYLKKYEEVQVVYNKELK